MANITLEQMQMQRAQDLLKSLGYGLPAVNTSQVQANTANLGNLGNPQVATAQQVNPQVAQRLNGLGAPATQTQATPRVRLMDVPAVVQQIIEAQKAVPMPSYKLSKTPTLERQKYETEKAQKEKELALSWYKAKNPTTTDSDVIKNNKMYLYQDLAKKPLDQAWADAAKLGRAPNFEELNKALSKIKTEVYAKLPDMLSMGLTQKDAESIIDYAYNLAGIIRPKEENGNSDLQQILGGLSLSSGGNSNP